MEQTIAAIATAYGEGGIGIIRISGDKSLEILEEIFCLTNRRINDGVNQILNLKNTNFVETEHPLLNRKLTYGFIKNPTTDEIIDEVMVVYMAAPHTYTKEDVVEIDCHGSIISLRKILDLVLSMGARMAEPGEFTKRAFLNGRLDLTQAEAVIDMIRAKTDMGYDTALSQLSGELSKDIAELRKKILNILVNITVNIEYPDEDIEELQYGDLIKGLSEITSELNKLLQTADTGKIIREGLKVAIVGKPNVGKSSLMNALLREQRAIVTEIAGTTRDTIDEMVSIKGIPVKLTDTAGIRETENIVEKIGIEKSKQSFDKADLILLVIDASEELSDEDRQIIAHIEGRPAIVLLNKMDLGMKTTETEVLDTLKNAFIINTAISKNEGIDELEELISQLVFGGKVKQNESVMVTNARHKALMEKANKSLLDAGVLAKRSESFDIIEIDIKSAYDDLGEIIGEAVSDDIIDEVFSRFCLGK